MASMEEKVLILSGKKKAIVRRETSAVSGMRVTIVHNKNRPKCRHTFYKASPEQLERYATLYYFRYDPKHMERGHIKKPSSLPSNYTGYRKHEQRSRSYSRIKKTSQLPRGSGPRLVCPSHNWKWYFAVNRISGLNSTQWLLQKSAEAHASGNREAFTHDDRSKANWWTTSWWEKSRWKWNYEV